MNKKLISILVVLSILAFTFASAFKPHVTQVKLLSVRFLEEKGVTFKFQVEGKAQKGDLKGNVLVSGKSLKLYCNYSGGSPVATCTAPGGTAKFAGKTGIVNVAGFSFYFVVPARLPGL